SPLSVWAILFGYSLCTQASARAAKRSAVAASRRGAAGDDWGGAGAAAASGRAMETAVQRSRELAVMARDLTSFGLGTSGGLPAYRGCHDKETCPMRVRSRVKLRVKIALASLLLASAAVWAAPASDLQARRDALNKLLAEQWEYTLSHAPEFASILGDKRWNDQISDFSQGAIDADLTMAKNFMRRF